MYVYIYKHMYICIYVIYTHMLMQYKINNICLLF